MPVSKSYVGMTLLSRKDHLKLEATGKAHGDGTNGTALASSTSSDQLDSPLSAPVARTQAKGAFVGSKLAAGERSKHASSGTAAGGVAPLTSSDS